jgi:xanthine dehydrogenase YagT iron-sulfur-binding subunit
MVLVDGDAMNACMMLAHDVAGRAVTTVEGLGGGTLSALQAELLAQDGAQCGFCTPGMLIAASSLLRDGVTERAEIERGMAGNLCRCGSYPHILSAIERVARGSADA